MAFRPYAGGRPLHPRKPGCSPLLAFLLAFLLAPPFPFKYFCLQNTFIFPPLPPFHFPRIFFYFRFLLSTFVLQEVVV